jgi:aminopeptidase N
MYVEHENAAKCDHALASLKKSMQWDEKLYGREYDLDIFMIVAVNDFNMGAMENKGLNIFNSSCVLATPETTTDAGFDQVEGIVAHEYFHNWSGNRVTCRDWFQLSLKEGFTVFRDSEFTADMSSRTVKRIEDVIVLRTAQFAEDAGPMAHPVRPASYIEISNFYTLTVYEKGAEVVRMIHTLLGAELFRKGSDLYFAKHDGQAVTTDDFVSAMEAASGRSLAQFTRWYSQAGTPIVEPDWQYDPASETFTLRLKQYCPPSPGQADKLPFHIPFALGLLDGGGNDMPLRLDGEVNTPEARTLVLDFTQSEQTFVFKGITEKPTPSLLRNFSAPVRLNYQFEDEPLLFLMQHDSDGFNRWDAGQKLSLKAICGIIESDLANERIATEGVVSERLVAAFRSLLVNEALDIALVAKMLQLPSEQYVIELSSNVDVTRVHLARERVRTVLAQSLKEEFKHCYQRHQASHGPYVFSFSEVAARTLKNVSLAYLLCIDDPQGLQWALSQFASAGNMTDYLGAMAALMQSRFQAQKAECIAAFYQKWKEDQQVIEQWFALQAASQISTTLRDIESLMLHPAFDMRNPNKVRSVVSVFAAQNLLNFHEKSGSGYRFLDDMIIKLDKLNPQVASRLLTPLSRWRKYDSDRQGLMLSALERIMASGNLSRDVYEVVSKSLAK